MKINRVALFFCAAPVLASTAQAQTLSLSDKATRLTWRRAGASWAASDVAVRTRQNWAAVGAPSGEYTVLYAPEDAKPAAKDVVENTAGTAFRFLASQAEKSRGGLRFAGECEAATVTADWSLDPKFAGDVRVTLSLRAKKRGYFSLATPTLTSIARPSLSWGMIPGYWQGTDLQPNFELAFRYGQGIPERPVLARERTATTLSPLLTQGTGAQAVTFAAIAEPGTGRDPWASKAITQAEWRLGLSLMDRDSRLSPTLYAPVLGEAGSLLDAGQSTTLRFRYSMRAGEWASTYTHAVEDVYRFAEGLAIKKPQRSLSQRLKMMQAYVTDPTASLWQTDDANGTLIGAQSYLGGVKGSRNKEAMKNSDLGAMWMLARITGDKTLRDDRLPLVRTFKMAQQETGEGFFRGAALGQYWLREQNRFVEEWGPYVEPIGLTYYTMCDIGNILLFQPDDAVLRERLRLGADTLLRWQKLDGSWDVAYNRDTHALSFPKLTDLRPTWYGLVVAYRVLGDRKYLDAARHGADWFVRNAVDKGHYLGVCGDTDFVMDFATGQSAQCLLDLFDITREARYREAAISAARLYWTWTFSHPMPTRQVKMVGGKPREDWEISQAGLSMEHGGSAGSANHHGPITLCSHAGMFVRFYEMTGDKLFLDMARHAAIGRDGLIDSKTGVASYYWRAMDAGPGPYPHHAWWQIGWIMDYLLAESHLRTNGKISFARGFVTPKVGPQQSVGFAPGTIFGRRAKLWMPPALLQSDNPNADTLGALSEDGKTLFALVLNQSPRAIEATLQIDPKAARPDAQNPQSTRLGQMQVLAGNVAATSGGYKTRLQPFGIAVVAVPLQS